MLGVLIPASIVDAVRDQPVNYVVTAPGTAGVAAAFAAEAAK